MSWAIGTDPRRPDRDIGYGVPAYCDHPGSWDHLANITRTLKAKAAEIDEVLRASGLPFPEPIQPKRKRASP